MKIQRYITDRFKSKKMWLLFWILPRSHKMYTFVYFKVLLKQLTLYSETVLSIGRIGFEKNLYVSVTLCFVIRIYNVNNENR